MPSVTISVLDSESGTPLPSRITLRAPDGKHHFAKPVGAGSAVIYDKQQRGGTSQERHTSCTANTMFADVPLGTQLTVEHGKEYLPTQLIIGEQKSINVRLKRWVNMAREGWFSGDTHIHRSLEDVPTVMAAEDLNVTFPLTSWVRHTGEVPPPFTAEAKSVYTDHHRVYWPLNTEYEIFYIGQKFHQTGAFFVLGHQKPMTTFAPPVSRVAAEAHAQGCLLEFDKHAWEWSMALPPLMGIHLYELSNNHVWQTEFGFPAWGVEPAPYMRIERNEKGLTERGWLDYGFQNYYALLNCGFRMLPTAGTANGVHPVPAGFGRVYAHIEGPFTYEKWWESLKAGRTFVTTGPMMTMECDGHPMGARMRSEVGAVTVSGHARSGVGIGRVEILVNGIVVKTVDGRGAKTMAIHNKITLSGESWIAVRCWENRPDGRPRFAHTAPWWISAAGAPLRPRREELEFLQKRVADEIARSESVHKPEVIAEYRKALQFYEAIRPSTR